MGKILQLLHISIILSLTSTWCQSSNELSTDNSSHDLMSPQDKREPISENSTLSKALALARQFLVSDENIVTSINVELFKRSDGSDGAAIKAVTEKPKKMYSWWTKKPSMTPEEPEEEEHEEEISEDPLSANNMESPTMQPEITTTDEITPSSTTQNSNVNEHASETPTTSTSATITMTNSITTEMMGSIPEIQPTTSLEIMSTSKPSMKPARPTKRPSKSKRPTLSTTSSSSNSDHLPPNMNNQEQTTTTTEEPVILPDKIKDPFGVKRKLVSIARSLGKAVINQTRTIASSTAERVGPAARNAARNAGIIALTAAGQVGTLTRNAAEDAYDDLAKRLNATELLGSRKKGRTHNSNGAAIHTTQGSYSIDQINVMGEGVGHKHFYDYKSCSQNVGKRSGFTVMLGMIGLVVMNFVIT